MSIGQSPPPRPDRPAALFATTHWSMVMLAGREDSPGATAALEALCRAYWYPIFAEVRRRGVSREQAQDHTQEFFAMLLRRNSLSRVAAEKGRFRTFLLAALNHFLADQSDAWRAAKRGGGVPLIELDALDAEQRFALEPVTDEAPDRAFDRRWAAALLERAFARLEGEQSAAGKGQSFAHLRPFLARPVESGEYETLAGELGMSANTMAKTVQRLRRRARELLLDEAAQTVAAAGDAEKELRDLFG